MSRTKSRRNRTSISSTVSTMFAPITNLFKSNKRRNINKDTIFTPSPRTLKKFYKNTEDIKKEILTKGRLKLNENIIHGGKNKSRKNRKSKKNNKN
jgi:hypothetical protein